MLSSILSFVKNHFPTASRYIKISSLNSQPVKNRSVCALGAPHFRKTTFFLDFSKIGGGGPVRVKIQKKNIGSKNVF